METTYHRGFHIGHGNCSIIDSFGKDIKSIYKCEVGREANAIACKAIFRGFESLTSFCHQKDTEVSIHKEERMGYIETKMKELRPLLRAKVP